MTGGHRVVYPSPVWLPHGYRLQEQVIVSDTSGCRFAWRGNRWLHLARCSCWKRTR